MEKSAVINHAQLVGTLDGKVIVPTYDWADLFDSPFQQRVLNGIKAMYHLTFTETKPRYALVKDSVDSPERELKLVEDDKWKPQPTDLPSIIPPPGLSLERRQYLFEKIREFCPECQDLVCPDPAQLQEYTTPPTSK